VRSYSSLLMVSREWVRTLLMCLKSIDERLFLLRRVDSKFVSLLLFINLVLLLLRGYDLGDDKDIVYMIVPYPDYFFSLLPLLSECSMLSKSLHWLYFCAINRSDFYVVSKSRSSSWSRCAMPTFSFTSRVWKNGG